MTQQCHRPPPQSPPLPLYCIILSWSVGQLDTEGMGTGPVGTFRKWKYFVANKFISTTVFQLCFLFLFNKQLSVYIA